MKKLIFFILIMMSSYGFSLGWQDLWWTSDQQGQKLMGKGQYKKAQQQFQQPDWRAAAAYRAGNYQQAADAFKQLKNEQGYYNQGNALAHLGQYEQAIKAYDQALQINPHNKDAKYNRKIIADLLKKDKNDKQNRDQQENQDQKNKTQQKENQADKQNNDQQNQQKQQQDQQNNEQQNQNDQDNKNQQNQSQKNTQEQQDKSQELKKKENQEKNQAMQEKQAKAKQDKNQKEQQPNNKTSQASQNDVANQEQQQAKEQWLRLIPDDPGGLLREKFLRDHLRRQGGWYQ